MLTRSYRSLTRSALFFWLRQSPGELTHRAWLHATRAVRAPKKPLRLLNADGSEQTLPSPNGSGSQGNESLGETESAHMTTLEKDVRRYQQEYPDAIILYQVGSFFELYYHQAREVAPLLGLKLTSKPRKDKSRYSFSGFPVTQLSRHLTTLVEKGCRAVIVEEIGKEDGSAVRKVTRVATPGTGLDDGFVNVSEINYVLAISVAGGLPLDPQVECISLVYQDVATGSTFAKNTSLNQLRDHLLLIQPREVVVSYEIRNDSGNPLLQLLEQESNREGWTLSEAHVPASSAAFDLLGCYLRETLFVSTDGPGGYASSAECVDSFDETRVMKLDSMTLKSLEVRESLRGGQRGSLYHAVKRTSTPGGARLLLRQLCEPSRDLTEINGRLDRISYCAEFPGVRHWAKAILKTLDDTSRVLQRLRLGKGNPALDLISLKRTLLAAEDLKTVILENVSENSTSMEEWISAWNTLPDVVHTVESSLNEAHLYRKIEEDEKKVAIASEFGLGTVEKIKESDEQTVAEDTGLWGGDMEAFSIKPGFSKELDELVTRLNALRKEAFELQTNLQKMFPAFKKLTLKTYPKLGAVVHITKRAGASSNSDLERMKELPGVATIGVTGSTATFVVNEWSTLYNQIETLRGISSKIEQRIVDSIISEVIAKANELSDTCSYIDQLDVALSGAEIAVEMNLSRPELNSGKNLDIVAGRHLVVEQSLSLQNRSFATNDIKLGYPDSFVHVITGPNMAGKSTYLRQTALICILAQAGMFVPAGKAKIGMVDQIFSRIGARDELDRDRSTFRIEMDEASSILDSATDHSLVLLDELGRGTSPLDGVAIAFATLEHLVNTNKCKTLFATHFHEISALVSEEEPENWKGIDFWCSDVSADGTYDHRIRKGLNDDSAGLLIARLAGMPPSVVERAEKIIRKKRN